MKKRTIKLKIDERAFQHLEVLAFGLNIEKYNDDKDNAELRQGHNSKRDDFEPLVSHLLEDIIERLVTGVICSGSWERNIVDSLTGWEGTINRGMFGGLVEIEKRTQQK